MIKKSIGAKKIKSNKKTYKKRSKSKSYKKKSKSKTLKGYGGVSRKKKTPEDDFNKRITNKCFSTTDVFDLEPFNMSDEESIITFTPPIKSNKEKRSFCYKKETFDAYVRHQLNAGVKKDRITDPSSKIELWKDETLHKVLNEIHDSIFTVGTDVETITINSVDDLEPFADKLYLIIMEMTNSEEDESRQASGQVIEVSEDKENSFRKFVATLKRTEIIFSDEENGDQEEFLSTLEEFDDNLRTTITNLVKTNKLNRELANRLQDELNEFFLFLNS